MIFKRGFDAEAMSAVGEDEERGRHIVAIQFGVIVYAVDGQYHLVVVRQDDEGARCDTCYVHVGAIQLLVFLLCLFAQQIVVRFQVGICGYHGDDGVEENLEVGLRLLKYQNHCQ